MFDLKACNSEPADLVLVCSSITFCVSSYGATLQSFYSIFARIADHNVLRANTIALCRGNLRKHLHGIEHAL